MSDTYVRSVYEAMQGYLPRYYDDIAEAQAVLNAYAVELEKLNDDIADVLAQFYVDTATWGLAKWEKMLGIPTDETKPLDQRRSLIKSKLRMLGTVTVSVIKNVAESFQYGEVDISEDPKNYTINVKFIVRHSIPPNLQDIKDALRDLIPAHLVINYSFNAVVVSNINLGQWQDETMQDPYPISGVYEQNNDNADAGNNMQLSALYLVTLQKTYPICGTFVAGEVV